MYHFYSFFLIFPRLLLKNGYAIFNNGSIWITDGGHGNMTKKFDFTGLGFCSNDYIALLPEIPLDSKVKMLEHLIQGGGPAATSTVAASRLGLKAAFISSVGDDDAGKKIIADFDTEKVFTKSIQIRSGKTSPVAYCWTDAPTGKRSVAWTSGDLVEVTPDEIDYELIAASRVLHLDGHHTRAALAAAKFAKANGVLVNMDAGTLRDGVPELLTYTDILIASEEFARRITGINDLDKAIFKLAEYGAKVTGITMGELGSMVLTPEKSILRCPAFKLEKVVDTTGAGDVYHTGFCVRYLETDDLMECMRFGSAVSALKCGKLGGRTGIPNRNEVDLFLKQRG